MRRGAMFLPGAFAAVAVEAFARLDKIKQEAVTATTTETKTDDLSESRQVRRARERSARKADPNGK